ncbi:hypothetical protein MKW98_008607 [Papaver atlanticum]|uniref:Uncharacterized protein n=1 Tax=Papaver atlanticum TaxID=357466 RepID=A0AAD4S536_9MAGN|nr:hypothetical protein MKW98_008607 [Papaver atlanticum]
MYHSEEKVNSCLVNGVWNLIPVPNNALGSVVEDVENVKTDHLIANRVVWTAGKSGDFVLRDTYNALRHKETKKK